MFRVSRLYTVFGFGYGNLSKVGYGNLDKVGQDFPTRRFVLGFNPPSTPPPPPSLEHKRTY